MIPPAMVMAPIESPNAGAGEGAWAASGALRPRAIPERFQ
jgi:hypothetical protein